MEEKTNVVTVSVSYRCDECKIGYMQPTGSAYLCHPPLYPHICDNKDCLAQKSFRIKYPIITHVPIPDTGVPDEPKEDSFTDGLD